MDYVQQMKVKSEFVNKEDRFHPPSPPLHQDAQIQLRINTLLYHVIYYAHKLFNRPTFYPKLHVYAMMLI